MLKWPPFCPYGGVQGNHCTLMGLSAHGEQTEPSHIFDLFQLLLLIESAFIVLLPYI